MLERQHPTAIPARPLGRRLSLRAPGELILSVLLVGCVLLGLYQLEAPAAQPSGSSLTDFSSGRAMRQLEFIAASPHPVGSPRQAEVEAFLVKELTALGVPPQVQIATAVNLEKGNQLQGTVPAGRVRNIAARLPGTDSSRAILLMAHYDSVPNSPGASDDGAGVAALLETVRALRARAPLRNDLIVLFTDGEEAWLLGAKAFVDEHPWAKDVGLVLNFEGRGSSGPVFMFETSDDNGALIREFAAAEPVPLANSLTYEIYKLLPNDTDLTIFKDAGFAALNFSYIDGFTHYHTALDTIETIDERSLQHHGSYALALARHFGNLDLRAPREPNAVYFNLLRSVLVRYPARLAVPLALAIVALLGAVTAAGLRRGRLSLRGMLLGCLAYLALLIAVPAAVYAVWSAVLVVHPQYRTMLFGDTYNSRLYGVAFVALAVALSASLYGWLRRWIRDADLAAGALVWWALLAVLSAVYLPGGSYLFSWPLLFGVLGLGLVLSARRPIERSPGRAAALAACAAPGVLLLTPMIVFLFVALGVGMSYVVFVFATLLLGLLIPHMRLLAARHSRLPALAGTIALAALVAGSLTSGYDPRHPATNNIFYALDADTGTGVWASTDQQPDAWTAQFFARGAVRGSLPEYFPNGKGRAAPRSVLQSAAPRAELAAPRATLLEDTTRDGRRTLRVRVTSPRRAQRLTIHSDPSVRLIAATIDGKPALDPAAGAERPWSLRYEGVPAEGVELTLVAQADGPIRFKLVDHSYGLPDIPGFSYTPRPAGIIASPYVGYIPDATLVSATYAF